MNFKSINENFKKETGMELCQAVGNEQGVAEFDKWKSTKSKKGKEVEQIDYILTEMKRCLLLGASYRLDPPQIAQLLRHINNLGGEVERLEAHEDFWRNELGIGDA